MILFIAMIFSFCINTNHVHASSQTSSQQDLAEIDEKRQTQGSSSLTRVITAASNLDTEPPLRLHRVKTVGRFTISTDSNLTTDSASGSITPTLPDDEDDLDSLDSLELHLEEKPKPSLFQKLCEESDSKQELTKDQHTEFKTHFKTIFEEQFKPEHIQDILKLSPMKLLHGYLNLLTKNRQFQDQQASIDKLTRENTRLKTDIKRYADQAEQYYREYLRIDEERKKILLKIAELEKNIITLKEKIRKDNVILEKFIGRSKAPTPTVQRALQNAATLRIGSPQHEATRQAVIKHHATLGSLPQHLHPKPDKPPSSASSSSSTSSK